MMPTILQFFDDVRLWKSIPEVSMTSLCLQSVVARGALNGMADSRSYVPGYINFSAQTSSTRTQEMIESKLEKKRKNILGAPSVSFSLPCLLEV